MREAALTGRSLIFTFTPEPSVLDGFAERARDVVQSAGGSVTFVRLSVSPAEQERRLTAPSRLEYGKIRSVEVLRSLRDRCTTCEAAMPRPAMTLDTEAADPAHSARLIAEALDLANLR